MIFNSYVFYATTFYEGVSSWLYITISIHLLSNSSLTAISLSLLIFSGVCISLSIVYMINRKKKDVYVQNNK